MILKNDQILGIILYIFWTIDYFYLKRSAIIFSSFLRPKNSIISYFFKISLYILGSLGLFLSIFSNSIISKKEKNLFTKSTSDTFIVLDVSRSMLAEDFSPNRFEVIKTGLKNFIISDPADRIGIILFAEKVFTYVPLTMDHNILLKMINDLEIGSLGNGTNIGDAIMLAINKLKKSEVENKSILLVTDGVGQVEVVDPVSSAYYAKDNHIKIYTIGVGKDIHALLPIYDSLKRKTYQEIPGGSYDDNLLKNIANITSAKFYKLDKEIIVKNVFDKISFLNQETFEIPSWKYNDEATSHLFVIGMIIFFGVEFFRRLILGEIIC